MRIDIMTLFCDMCDTVLGESIIGRARAAGKVEINTIDIRDYTEDKHRRVDDKPYGGGMGMVMQAEPIYRCYNALCEKLDTKPHLIYMTPQGKTLTQKRVTELAKLDSIAILCGHYEGVDERVIEELQPEEISIGDYVLTGGELPALILADSISRMLPGVLANNECFEEESHFNSLLEYPQYTHPSEWRGREVPEVLLSGHHENVNKWRREQSLKRTLDRRPDMLKNAELTKNDKSFLSENE
ncbi:MAG: tRNA (guanosine(37)-N1)-methyltransferase TrmD [Eubacterium sp.]|nr:tRNA (guanosine(37)-N1)-methyltransferase TrmD [Eubacterium sp.]